jgi:uncharacterized protein YutE (UPF0331/DUF86 family)
MMEAAAAARRARIGAVLSQDPRVRFAYLAGVEAEPESEESVRPCVAVYVDRAEDADTVGRDVAARLAGHPDAAGLGVAVLNTLEMEAAGRLVQTSALLLDRDSAARIAFEIPVTGAYFDFRESEALVLRERAERPYDQILSTKLKQLEEQIRRLRELAGLDAAGYASDWKAAYVVERALEVAIDVCIGIATHTVAERRLGSAATYRGQFVIARDAGLLEPDLAAALMRMCGFRNRLAHEPLHLDPAAVVSALASGIADIERFRDAAARW